MQVQYYGDYCFKLTTKPGGRATEDVIIWFDPLEKGSGLRSPQGEAGVVFLTHGDPVAIRETLKGEPVVIDAPGEYAVKGIAALGYPAFQDNQEGRERGQNTIFTLETEELHLAFLGALGHDLAPELLDKLNGADIVFLPIGGAGTIAPKLAAELVRKLEPKMVIPMHYKIPGLTLPVESEKAFCKELGSCPASPQTKLNIKKKDLEGKQGEVVLLERGV